MQRLVGILVWVGIFLIVPIIAHTFLSMPLTRLSLGVLMETNRGLVENNNAMTFLALGGGRQTKYPYRPSIFQIF